MAELTSPYQELNENTSSKDHGKSCCALDGKYAWHAATLSLFWKTVCTAASMSSAQVMHSLATFKGRIHNSYGFF